VLILRLSAFSAEFMARLGAGWVEPVLAVGVVCVEVEVEVDEFGVELLELE